jgi:hypothetical protein
MTALDQWSSLKGPARIRLVENITRTAVRQHRPDPTHGQDMEAIASQPYNRLDPDLREELAHTLTDDADRLP